MKNKINFIIPCAGFGTRLGIPFSKELYPISKDLTLIDSVFENIREFKNDSRIIIVIEKHKVDLIQHIRKYSDDFDIIFIYQKYPELSGAILTCEDYFSDVNILLLPDIFISDENITHKIKDLIIYTKLNKVCYLVKNESDFSILKRLGAVNSTNNTINYMEEKPQTNNNYNAYWVSIGFNSVDFIHNFVKFQKHEDYDKKYFSNINCVFIDYALDLGVWENIRRFECDLAGKKLILK